ncbi:hypothetical protein DAQ1742_04271 [Dickeya aquatica]|uniref:Uncharacterized protein n=1 Tax=Dickeya aquatica TaxID=1401087 RepID=A0A375AG08_9GAMM|nr:hypothetical protein DAQ1742_04271 [Dickeya aquatica]
MFFYPVIFLFQETDCHSIPLVLCYYLSTGEYPLYIRAFSFIHGFCELIEFSGH